MMNGIAGLIDNLPDRFRPGPATPQGRFRLRTDGIELDVVIDGSRCVVEPVTGDADVDIYTDEGTWRDLWTGRMSGVEAFAKHRLLVTGGIELALRFEPSFERPDRGGLDYEMQEVRVKRNRISVLTAGRADADPLLLIHGLGATKASWLTVVPLLAQSYRVIVVDLPGFGASSKPLAPYTAGWFSHEMLMLLDAMGIERTFVAGNSMGGRIAMEMGMQGPDRVRAITCLCPAAAFSERPWLWLVKLMRPELAFMLPSMSRERLIAGLRQLFADPRQVEQAWFEAAADDFSRTWRSPRARIAFSSSARRIYMDEPSGETGFWARLAEMSPPSLYVYGSKDTLITARFARRMQQTLPSAEVAVWDDCGHVPQIEHPERTVELMTRFFEAADRSEGAEVTRRVS